MSIETIVLLENISTEATTAGFSYGEKRKGAGYHKNNNGVHTALFQFDNFVGTVKIQGTLELYPNDTDWVDIDGTTITVEDSSALTQRRNSHIYWQVCVYTCCIQHTERYNYRNPI
jgi:hypothetical protein